MRPRFATALLAATLLVASGLDAGRADAASALRLSMESPFGFIPAATWDEHSGDRVGDAKVGLATLPSGNLLLVASGAASGEGAIAVSAELERTEDGSALRPVWQQSHSWRADGGSQGEMWIDHRAGIAVCIPAENSGEQSARVALPSPDRVANVPMHLVLQALARGDANEAAFQFLACKARRVADVTARVVSGPIGDARLVEVSPELDLGPILTPLARAFLPNFSFWFDPARAGSSWVAHRMPLFTGGPQVLVVRGGLTPRDLGSGH